jgi:predicted nucleic acid-binding protein
MEVLLDTNVLVAASIRQHPHFGRADAVLQRCVDNTDRGIVHAHSLLEFHSAVTQLPSGLSIPPAYVNDLLDKGILPFVRIMALTAKQVRGVQQRAGRMGLIGGAVYDLFHLALAEREHVERLYTFNVIHFRRMASPEMVDRIVAP